MYTNNQQARVSGAGGFIFPFPQRQQSYQQPNNQPYQSYPGLAQSALYPILPGIAPVAHYPTYPTNMSSENPGYPQAYPGNGPVSGYPTSQAPYPDGGGGYPDNNNYPAGMGYPTSQMPQPSTANLPTAQPQNPVQTQSQHYQLTVACKNLANKDVFSKSDPVCILYEMQMGNWMEIARTEKIKDDLNPAWVTKFYVKKKKGQNTQLKFDVYDWDSKSNSLKKHDFLASHQVSLDTILNSSGRQYVTVIKDGPSKRGQFIITAETLTSDKHVVKFQLGARNLDKKDTFGKSDPYFVINKVTGHGKMTPVHKSDVVMNTLNPTWAPVSISIRKLCNGEYNCKLTFDVYDYDKNSPPDLIGSFSTTVNELKDALAANKIFSVINPKKQSKRHYRNSGEVFVKDFSMWEANDFMDAS